MLSVPLELWPEQQLVPSGEQQLVRVVVVVVQQQPEPLEEE